MADDHDDDLYIGRCDLCDTQYVLTSTQLITTYPQLADVFLAGTPFIVHCDHCKGDVSFIYQDVITHPFSAWTVLPAAHGCPLCGRDHDLDTPHDANSLVYQYSFRSSEVKAGRPARWPTWRDAMAHCHPGVQESWVVSLREHGVDL